MYCIDKVTCKGLLALKKLILSEHLLSFSSESLVSFRIKLPLIKTKYFKNQLLTMYISAPMKIQVNFKQDSERGFDAPFI